LPQEKSAAFKSLSCGVSVSVGVLFCDIRAFRYQENLSYKSEMEGPKNLTGRKSYAVVLFQPKSHDSFTDFTLPVFQVSIALLCMKIKDSRFSSDSFLFRTRNWEDNGEIYDKVFRIRKWKKLLPDGGALTKADTVRSRFRIRQHKTLKSILLSPAERNTLTRCPSSVLGIWSVCTGKNYVVHAYLRAVD
jgi:hypothetical protein